jgi:prevent-host-death family protein
MDKIRYSELLRSRVGDVLATLPLTVTSEGVPVAVLLTTKQYARLVETFKENQG